MAGGNLGDLWFQLGVKDNTSKELQKIIDKLKTGDDAANSLLRALQGFGTKKSGFKEQAEKAKEFADVLNEINRRISKLKKNDKSDEAKDLQTAVKNALSYLDMLQRINIERSKISELRSLNPNVDTSKLKEAELMLENVNNQLYRLQNKAQGGGGGGVDYANVLQDYAKVLQMTFRDVKQITDQFKKENPLSAFSGGAAKVKAGISQFFKNDQGLKNIKAEIDSLLARLGKVREDITLYQHAIGTGTKEGISFGQQGLKEANAEAEKLMGTITALQNVYDTLRVSQANVKDLIGQTPQKQRQDDIQKKMSEYYSNLEKTSAKQAAQATRDAAKAKREDIAAEKQRQTEIKNTERRYDSLGNKVRQLRSEYSRGITIGADVSKAEAEISRLLSLMRGLRTIKDRLNSENWKDSLGMLGNIGSGHDTTLASRVLQDQRAVNREVQRGVELEQKRQQEIAKSAARVQSDLVRGFEKANSHAGKLNSTVQDLKSLFLQGGLVFGAQQFAMSIITTGGEMEKQHIALQSILGDMQNANTMFNQIKELALNSPFTFSELNRDVKQLAAYGVEYDQLYDTTKRLADMSSGLGVGFDRIALAFGQVQARGWLDGKELRQIAYAGIPLLEKLSEFYSKQEGRNVSTSEIKTRISNREVSFDDVKSIFWQMTDAGGQFYNMQQTLSETLLGRYNKLKDAWEIMLADFANGKNIVGSTFKEIIDLVTTLVQSLHTVGPAIAAVFAGPLLKKGLVALEGGIGKNILTSKANVASGIMSRVVQGQKISSIEKKILATKNQITLADIKNLAKANAITKVELRRLYISGRITKEMYKQGMALTKQVDQSKQLNLWGAMKNVFSGSGIGAAGGLILDGLKSFGSSILSFFGGIPGIAISAATTIFAYWQQKNAQLKQEMDTTAEELQNRYTSISEFLRDNDADKAINDGDEKNIENLIDAYKEKLKEVAPEKANAFEMSLTEKKSNEDRLRYLKQQLELLKQIEAESKKKLSDEDSYESFDDLMSEAKNVSESYSAANAKTNAINASNADFRAFEIWESKYEEQIRSMRSLITKELGDISKDPKLQGEANQIMSSFFSKQGWDQNVADQFRADVLNSMGVTTNLYEDKFKSALESAINTTYPWIGDKIRNNQELTDAERTQVTNIMNDAAAQIKRDYPHASNTLKRMLAEDRFEAVIHLVFDKTQTELELQAGKNTQMSGGDGNAFHRRTKIAQQIAKSAGNSRSKFKSDFEASVEAARKEERETLSELNKGKTTLDAYNASLQDYNDKKLAFYEQFGYSFTGDEKKTGGKKGGHKNTGGVKTDKALEDLKKRIDLYKKMYAEIKKFKELYGEGALGQLANDGEFGAIFGDKKRFPISDYTNYETSIKELLKTLPASTKDRLDYAANEKAGIQTENRKLLEEQRRDELNVLNKQLDTISEQYETYKKIYELTGNKKGAQNVAFGGIVQFDTYKKFLEEQLDIAVKHDNVQSGLKLTTDEVKGMSLENVKDKYGEESRAYDIRKKLEDESNKIKKETIDLMANLIEKNATIAQQIEDENRRYERQLELIKGIEDPEMRDRAKAGATKTHNENTAKLQFEQFKQESDWVTIFDDLDRVSSATISSMITKIDDFSRTTGLSVEVVKQLRDALDKLRKEDIDRNPLPYIFGAVNQGDAIGGYLKGNLGAQYMNGKKYVPTAEQAKKMGIEWSASGYSKNELASKQKGKYADSSNAINSLAGKFKALEGVLDPVVNLFKAMGEEDSILGQITGGASNALSAASQVSGGLNALGLGNLGPYGAAVGAGLSVASSLIGAFGADYSEYNKAKQKYETLSSIWDSLIQKKSEYMNIHWGTEAANASKEAQEMLEAEIKQTKVIALKNFNSGASAGSHSIKVRDWKKRGWREAAPEISKRYGVKFDSMTDILNIDYKILQQIKKDYAELWANLDEDSRTYLDKLIEYGEKSEDMIEALTEKLTGNKYSDLISAWGEAMASMSNTSDNLVDHFEENLRNVILKSMIENLYGEKIKALIEKTKKYGDPNGGTEKKLDTATGKVMSEYTNTEMNEIGKDLADVTKQIEASRDYLKRYYGWSDNSSSSLTNSVKGITEDTGDLIASYLNSIRLDVSVIREEQVKCMSESNEIAKSQLTQLNFISANTLRNAEAAERIERVFEEYSSNFNMVINGVKSIKVR